MNPYSNENNKHPEEIEEVIHYNDRYYILATSPSIDDQNKVLKSGNSFAIFDRFGDIQPLGLGEQGIFYQGTRFISRLELRIDKKRPLLLNSKLNQENNLFVIDLTNPDFKINGDTIIPRGSLHIFRSKFLWQQSCYERIRFSNYSQHTVSFEICLIYRADYADIFEVRGLRRARRGKILPENIQAQDVTLSYEGLDGVIRKTHLNTLPVPQSVNGNEIIHHIELSPLQHKDFYVTVSCEIENKIKPVITHYEQALNECQEDYESLKCKPSQIISSNEQFNKWILRSMNDINMMISRTAQGLYPYAGIPWYCTVFGRDGIITALEMLWMEPELARGVLEFLATTQAHEDVPQKDAEPGKIMHEMRHGEMANLGEVPFDLYYGSVDTTPLFIYLAGAYYERTADLEFIRNLWPHLKRALDWIELYGDRDRDGFVEYCCRSKRGLLQQGWKDSQDSIFDEFGNSIEAPIALCEVQAYVYGAYKAAGIMAAALGKRDEADEYREKAATLREKFEKTFWWEEMGTYVLALDRNKRPCRVSTSNAGQCLFSGIASDAHAKKVIHHLMSPELFSGWGIRTLSTQSLRYNPMSYHNGSVWPHDNALIAWGMSRYHLKSPVCRIMNSFFEASIYHDLARLPELFCGFTRMPDQAPTLYPVACSPQAWASASSFLLLQSCLGLSIRALESRVYFYYPVLPESVSQIQIHNLRVGKAKLDLEIQRHASSVTIYVLKREGNVDIVTIK